MKKNKLLIYTKSVDGGTGTFVEALLKLTEIQTKVLVTQKPQYREIKSQNYHYCFSQKKYPEKYFFLPSVLVNLLRERFWLDAQLQKFKPDIVLTVDAHCLLVYSIFRQSSIKLIATIHNHLLAVVNYRVPIIFRELIKQLLKSYLNKADRVVCVSKGLAKNIKKEFKLHRTPKVIYYGINRVNKTSLRLKDRLNKPILLSIGRFCEQKDFLTIIKAFSTVKLKVPQSQLWLVGDGPQKSMLQNYIRKNKVTGVRFLGWQQNLEKIYQKASVFVFSSNWEGFGWVILEAMAYGLPVVATDTDFGPRELLDKRYGLLVPKNEYFKLPKQITELINNKNKYYDLVSLSYIHAKKYSLKAMLKAYSRVFKVIK